MPEKTPQSPSEWIREIVWAYRDAAETIPFGRAVDAELTEKNLFHLAPHVCLKRRGIKRTRKNQETVTDAALSTYVANEKMNDASLSNPIMAFSLCYVASHYALSLLDEKQSESILNFVEMHLDEMQAQIEA